MSGRTGLTPRQNSSRRSSENSNHQPISPPGTRLPKPRYGSLPGCPFVAGGPAGCQPAVHPNLPSTTGNIRDSQPERLSQVVFSVRGRDLKKLEVRTSVDELMFWSEDQQSHAQMITLYNPHEFHLDFVVGCSTPNAYTTQPMCGVLRARQCLNIAVCCCRFPRLGTRLDKLTVDLYTKDSEAEPRRVAYKSITMICVLNPTSNPSSLNSDPSTRSSSTHCSSLESSFTSVRTPDASHHGNVWDASNTVHVDVVPDGVSLRLMLVIVLGLGIMLGVPPLNLITMWSPAVAATDPVGWSVQILSAVFLLGMMAGMLLVHYMSE